jgi:hypothetical protein
MHIISQFYPKINHVWSQVGHVNDSIGDGVVFQLELKDRNYVLRTSTIGEAEKWMYKLRKLRDEALASSIPEETSLDGSTRDSGRAEAKKSESETRSAPSPPPSGEWSKANVQISGESRGDKKACCCVIS